MTATWLLVYDSLLQGMGMAGYIHGLDVDGLVVLFTNWGRPVKLWELVLGMVVVPVCDRVEWVYGYCKGEIVV